VLETPNRQSEMSSLDVPGGEDKIDLTLSSSAPPGEALADASRLAGTLLLGSAPPQLRPATPVIADIASTVPDIAVTRLKRTTGSCDRSSCYSTHHGTYGPAYNGPADDASGGAGGLLRRRARAHRKTNK
jgi:hypothetical protein